MSAPNTAAETHGRLDYRWQAHDMRPAPHQPSPHDTSLLTYIGSHTVARTLIRARFSPLASTGQRFIVSGSANGDVVIYNVLSGQVERRLAAHRDICRDVSWHPHTDTIISSSVRKALSAFASMKRVHSDGTLLRWSHAEQATSMRPRPPQTIQISDTPGSEEEADDDDDDDYDSVEDEDEDEEASGAEA